VIPVKPLHLSKSRLAAVLPAAERGRLIRGILQHTLAVLADAPLITETLVVSSDEVVLHTAVSHQARTLAEPAPQGLNRAVGDGAATAAAAGADAVLVLPADLPFLRPADVVLMAETLEWGLAEGGLMSICPDGRYAGSNALLLAPPRPFTFHYGRDSFSRHMVEAARRRRARHVVQAPGLQFDLDTERDWRFYRACKDKPQRRREHREKERPG
jgi:2-phospho-L-lactate guanylyltransferase